MTRQLFVLGQTDTPIKSSVPVWLWYACLLSQQQAWKEQCACVALVCLPPVPATGMERAVCLRGFCLPIVPATGMETAVCLCGFCLLSSNRHGKSSVPEWLLPTVQQQAWKGQCACVVFACVLSPQQAWKEQYACVALVCLPPVPATGMERAVCLCGFGLPASCPRNRHGKSSMPVWLWFACLLSQQQAWKEQCAYVALVCLPPVPATGMETAVCLCGVCLHTVPATGTVYLQDGFASTSSCAATLRNKLQTKFATSPCLRMATLGKQVSTMTLKCKATWDEATKLPMLM